MSALVTRGSIDDFAVEADESMSVSRLEAFGDIKSFGVLENATPLVSFSEFSFPTSRGSRGLALKRLYLSREAQKFFKRRFHLKSNIYVLSWGWDLSGQPIYVYPVTGVTPPLIAMRGGDTQEFLGGGDLLFPPRPIVSGLQLNLQVWQSKKGIRTFGAAMHDVAESIDNSELNRFLRPLAMLTPHTAMVKAAEELAVKLVGTIGQTLASYGDEMVNLFSGCYSARERWPRTTMVEKGNGATVELTPLR